VVELLVAEIGDLSGWLNEVDGSCGFSTEKVVIAHYLGKLNEVFKIIFS